MEKFMLPNAWKKAGWALIAAGAVLTGFYIFTSFRITMPVPVLFSAFLEIKYLTSFRTNVADELVMLTLLAGFFLVIFSKDKQEEEDSWDRRGKALFKALFCNSIVLLLSIIFIYGQGFMGMLIVQVFSLFIFYLLFYYRAKRR